MFFSFSLLDSGCLTRIIYCCALWLLYFSSIYVDFPGNVSQGHCEMENNAVLLSSAKVELLTDARTLGLITRAVKDGLHSYLGSHTRDH